MYFVCFTGFRACLICQKLFKLAGDTTRGKVREWLPKYPKSVWWINNKQVAKYCKVADTKKLHKTAILGKYLTRKQSIWHHKKGLHTKKMHKHNMFSIGTMFFHSTVCLIVFIDVVCVFFTFCLFVSFAFRQCQYLCMFCPVNGAN